MPLQWINGNKPKGLIDEQILVIGPDNMDDEQHVRIVLDDYTLKMESVCIILNGEGNLGKHRPKGFTYEGVICYAYEWACRHYWPLQVHNPGWWCSSGELPTKGRRREAIAKKARSRMNAVILERLLASGKKHAHCLAFWDQECEITEELMELTREVIPMKNFNIVRI